MEGEDKSGMLGAAYAGTEKVNMGDARVRAAVMRLQEKRMPITRANIAEEMALDAGGMLPPAKAQQPQGPVRGGPNASPEMMDAIKRRQEERNRAFLEQKMRERGVRR